MNLARKFLSLRSLRNASLFMAKTGNPACAAGRRLQRLFRGLAAAGAVALVFVGRLQRGLGGGVRRGDAGGAGVRGRRQLAGRARHRGVARRARRRLRRRNSQIRPHRAHHRARPKRAALLLSKTGSQASRLAVVFLTTIQKGSVLSSRCSGWTLATPTSWT